MSVYINFKDLWTYNTKLAGEVDEKLPITYLDDKVCTHIHGELQIKINDRVVPHMSYAYPDNICIGYWIERLARLLSAFKSGAQTFTIWGEDHGMPDYKFDKEGDDVCLSIVDSLQDGEGDPDWVRVPFKFADLEAAFIKFKESFINEVRLHAPNVLEYWSSLFETK